MADDNKSPPITTSVVTAVTDSWGASQMEQFAKTYFDKLPPTNPIPPPDFVPLKEHPVYGIISDKFFDMVMKPKVTAPVPGEKPAKPAKVAKVAGPLDISVRSSFHVKAVRKTHFADCKCRFCTSLDATEGPLAYQAKSTKYTLRSIPESVIRSQKALGIKLLIDANPIALPASIKGVTWLAQDIRHLRPIIAQIHREMAIRAHQQGSVYTAPEQWVRPCPTTPRHGFVDSRVCRNLRELQDLMREAKKADKDAELLIQPKINAVWSAILTDSHVSVGPGNNGATAGKDSFMFKLVPENKDYALFHKPLLQRARIGEDQDAYAEIVRASQGYTHVVQLRAGPKLPPTYNFIPQDVTVTRVRTLKAGEDEFAWEGEAKALASEPGVVVYHPGGTMSSHFGVHCVINNVPYITTFAPTVGQAIAQESESGQPNYDMLREGLKFGLASCQQQPLTEWGWRGLLGIMMLHNYAAEHGEDASYMLGMSTGWLWKMMTAACLGEYRHVLKYAREDETFTSELVSQSKHRSRESIFQRALVKEGHSLVPWLQEATTDFLARPNWPASYGGLYWGRSGLMTLRFWDTMYAFIGNPNAENATALVAGLNTLIHAAHNGGLLLNKFVGTGQMDEIARMDRRWLLQFGLGYLMQGRQVMLETQKHAATYAPATVAWSVEPDLQKYADNPDSVRRCECPSGNLAEYKTWLEQKQATEAIGHWIWALGVWLDQAELRAKTDAIIQHTYTATMLLTPQLGAIIPQWGTRYDCGSKPAVFDNINMQRDLDTRTLLNSLGITSQRALPSIVQFWREDTNIAMVQRTEACEFWPEIVVRRTCYMSDLAFWQPFFNTLKRKES